MSQETILSNTEVSFKDFLFKNKRNRTILWIAAVAIVIQFSVFKYFYPFASFIHGDSFVYIESAYKNLNINTYLIGYSRFLRLISVFTTSDTALVAIQYLLIQISALFLLYTIFYFYNPKRITKCILLCFIVLNPLLLHLSNLVSSDGVFVTLSLFWISLLLWIIHKPSISILILHLIILFVVFTVRYNALLYPFISAGAICASTISLRRKIQNITLGLLICGLFIGYTSYNYKKLTGYWQYSPFGGWQLANNAMYAYRYIDSSDRKVVPKKFQTLDYNIRKYFDTHRDTSKYEVEKIKAGTFYMWSPGLPLVQYQNQVFKNNATVNDFKKWASMGPYYKSYGIFLIKQYPWQFLKYFIWPNANKYYAPPLEFLRSYNSGKDSVLQIAKIWFEYKSVKLSTRTKDQNIVVLDAYPILSGIINVVMLCTLLCYFLLKGWTQNKEFSKGVYLSGTVWLTNAAFTIGASSAALRFQSFPILLTTLFTILLIDWMVGLMANLKNDIVSPISSKSKKPESTFSEAVVKSF